MKFNYFEDDLHRLYERILRDGEHRADRTGTGTLAVFAEDITIDLSLGFPAVTTKKLAWNPVKSELLWFIEGSGNERRLCEILHGTRDPSKKTIWSPNAEATSGAMYQPKFPGDLGRVYGVQWRDWSSVTVKDRRAETEVIHSDGSRTVNAKINERKVDQLANVIDTLMNKPTDRRIILSAWNPGELDQMALPPCHMFAQFYLSNDRRLSCQMYQRSVDTFLGLPFNIASYALLTHMIAHVIGADVGKLKMVLGDTHIYMDHIDQVREQLTRKPMELPILNIKRKLTNIDDFRMEDFELVGYQSHAAIAGKMSA